MMSLRNGELREENGHGAKMRILPQAGRAAWGRGGCVKENGLLLNRSNLGRLWWNSIAVKGYFVLKRATEGNWALLPQGHQARG